MKQNGFGLLIAVILILQLGLIEIKAKNEAYRKNSEFEKHAIEMEKAFFRRAEIENNIDFLIKKTIEKEILSKNTDPKKIKEKVAQKIAEFAEQNTRQDEKEQTYFFMENSEKKEVETQALEKTMQVVVLNNGKITAAQLFFTGGEHKDTVLKAKIRHQHFSNEFTIPVGYSVEVLVTT